MLTWDAARLVDLAGVMWSAAEVGAVTPMIAILTLSERLAVFDIVVIGAAPCAKEGIMTGAIGPGVIEVIAGVVDLIVGHVGKGRHAVSN